MSGSNVDLFRRWFEEVWNQRREASIDELCDPQVKGYGLGEAPIVGPEGFKVFWRSFLETFSDLHVEVLDAIESGEKVAGHLRVTGKHVGSGLGVPPSGKDVVFAAHVFAIWRNGRIVEAWNLVDMAGIMKQVSG